jgi:CPA1 family monovalent cation:H+ antiporter
MLPIVATLLVLTAAFAYVNHTLLKWPTTIGVMAIALMVSLGIIGLDKLGFATLRDREHELLASIDFADVLLEGMLSLLLFAGALHVDLHRVRRLSWQIGVLAVIGTAASAAVIGGGCWLLLGVCDAQLPLIWCLLFGALISPTDPIAVLGVLESAHAPPDVETTIAGESLVNDGAGVVLFALLLDMLHSGTPPTIADAFALFSREALGGVLLGIVIGLGVNRVLQSIDDYRVEVLITLATVVGGYALARELHTSGPLAMVAVGLLVGNEGRMQSMSQNTRERVDLFWQMLDEILNSVLFVLIGLEFAAIRYPPGAWKAALLVITLSLLARFLVVGLPVLAWPRWFALPAGSAALLTWSGVRGGISVALALSLPAGPNRDIVQMLTYSVVVFTILVQGLTVGRLVRGLGMQGESLDTPSAGH